MKTIASMTLDELRSKLHQELALYRRTGDTREGIYSAALDVKNEIKQRLGFEEANRSWLETMQTVHQEQQKAIDANKAAIEALPKRLEKCPAVIQYINHRREIAMRTIIPHRIQFGTSQWHPEPQWLMIAYDMDKNAWRTFAMTDVLSWRPPPWQPPSDASA